jgi:2'-5' RNA ligase
MRDCFTRRHMRQAQKPGFANSDGPVVQMGVDATQPMRCFVALDLTENFLAAAVRAQAELQALDLFHGRFTARENIHLTLKFLGEIPANQVPPVAEALRNLRAPAFDIQLAGAGMFAPRIVWLKLAGADALQKQVDAVLGEWFAPETRFMGHITITRMKTVRQREALAEAVRELTVAPVAARAVSLSLRQSTLHPEGPKYEVLERFDLLDE